MEVIHEAQGPVDVFRISGRMDYSATAGDFDRRIREPWERNQLRRFPVLDLSGVTMLGSQALRGILALAKDIKGQSGTVFVCAPSPAAEEALKISGFLQIKVFELHESRKEAILAATLAAKKAPALKTDDPWAPPPEPPPPPPAPKGLKAVLAAARNAASATGKTWNSLALLIQNLLDRKAKK